MHIILTIQYKLYLILTARVQVGGSYLYIHLLSSGAIHDYKHIKGHTQRTYGR